MEDDNIIIEWTAQYVSSSELQRCIRDLKLLDEQDKHSDGANITLAQRKDIQDQFNGLLRHDIIKIEDFYKKQLEQATNQYLDTEAIVDQVDSGVLRLQQFNKDVQHNFLDIIDQNIIESYRKLNMLLNYCQTNNVEIRRLVKNMGAVLNDQHFVKQYMAQLESLQFIDSTSIDNLKRMFEHLYAILHGVNEHQAQEKMQKTLVIKRQMTQSKNVILSTFLFALFCILYISYIEGVYVSAFRNTLSYDNIGKIVFQMQAVMLYQQYITLAFGLVLLLCQYNSINFSFLLELPANVDNELTSKVFIYGFSSINFNIIISNLLIQSYFPADNLIFLPLSRYFKLLALQLQPKQWQFVLVAFFSYDLYWLMRKVFNGNQGVQHLFMNVYKSLQPFRGTVNFPTFIISCTFTSCTAIIRNIFGVISLNRASDWVLCIFQAFPSLIRVIQCLIRLREQRPYLWYPHLVNAIINTLGILGTFIHATSAMRGGAFWFFFLVRVIETVGKIYWDIAEDAGLITGGYGCKGFPIDKYKYHHLCKRPSFMSRTEIILYIIFMIVGRSLWMVSVFSGFFIRHDFQADLLAHILFLCEVLRRTVWALFRMDNQQATNNENYMNTRFVPILQDNQTNNRIRCNVQSINTKEMHQNISLQQIHQVIRHSIDVLRHEEQLCRSLDKQSTQDEGENIYRYIGFKSDSHSQDNSRESNPSGVLRCSVNDLDTLNRFVKNQIVKRLSIDQQRQRIQQGSQHSSLAHEYHSLTPAVAKAGSGCNDV